MKTHRNPLTESKSLVKERVIYPYYHGWSDPISLLNHPITYMSDEPYTTTKG